MKAVKDFFYRFFNMKEYYRQIKANRLFKNITIMFTIVACGIFILFSIVAATVMSGAAMEQIAISEQKMLEQAENTSDTILSNINHSMTDTFENDIDITNILSEPYSFDTSLLASSKISKMKGTFGIIDKVYFINLTDDVIYTGENPAYTKASFPDTDFLDYVKSAQRYEVNKPCSLTYSKDDSKIENKTENFLVSLYKLSDERAMAVFISSASYDSLVNAQTNPAHQSMTILNRDGIVISSTVSGLFGKDMNDDSIYQRLIAEPYASGTVKQHGQLYFYRTSDILNTFYVSKISRSYLFGTFALQLVFVILFGTLLVFILFLCSIRMSISAYRPFRRLRRSISDILEINDSEQSGTDEDLQLVAKNLVSIKDEYNSMKSAEQSYTNTKRSELIYNIINGAYNFNSEVLDEYGIRFPFKYSTIIIVRLDNAKKVEYGDIGLVLYGISNVAAEIMTTRSMVSYSTTFGHEYDAVIIANHTAPEFDENLILHIQKYIANIFQLTASVSYSTAEHDIENLPQLYRNAEYALQYRIVRGYNCIIDYDTLDKNISSSAVYPEHIEKDIIKGINSKNQDMIEKSAEEFVDYLSSLPYVYITVYSCMLIIAIDRHSPPTSKNSDYEHDTITDELTKIETIDALKDIIISKCKSAIVASDEQHQDTKYIMIANNIADYIDENYTDPNLSIHTISAYVNKSANYTRNIFKQNKGISISDYITKKRFEEVCRLLLETNMTAQAIGQQIGMSSGSYFYTAFKKYTGYTPEQFRKKYTGTDFDFDSL